MFRGINRWGQPQDRALRPNSVIPLPRQTLQRAGLEGELYSSHSPRRGFASSATRNGWDQKSLMSYVG